MYWVEIKREEKEKELGSIKNERVIRKERELSSLRE